MIPNFIMYIRARLAQLIFNLRTICNSMYSTFKIPSLFVFGFLILFSSTNLICQTQDNKPEASELPDVFFEKIKLDGKTSYRNETTGEIISQSSYILLCEGEQLKDGSEHEGHTHHDYWECNKINPYKDVVLQTPFKIEFDQTTFTHPVDNKIVVTSRFGKRRRGPHRGLDLDLVTGDFVRSVLPGKVRFVGYSRGHGKTVVVRRRCLN